MKKFPKIFFFALIVYITLAMTSNNVVASGPTPMRYASSDTIIKGYRMSSTSYLNTFSNDGSYFHVRSQMRVIYYWFWSGSYNCHDIDIKIDFSNYRADTMYFDFLYDGNFLKRDGNKHQIIVYYTDGSLTRFILRSDGGFSYNLDENKIVDYVRIFFKEYTFSTWSNNLRIDQLVLYNF